MVMFAYSVLREPLVGSENGRQTKEVDYTGYHHYIDRIEAHRDDFNTFDSMPLTNSLMGTIAREHSIDTANLYFLSRMYKDNSENHTALNRYRQLVSALHDETYRKSATEKLRTYQIVFIPGFAYIRDQNSGADFSRQRKLLDRYGIRNELVVTKELGLVEENAQRIANYFRGREYDRPLVVVSVSKGSLDFAEALGSGKLNGIVDIHAWVNVGGIMKGSFIAEKNTAFPRSIVTSALLYREGVSLDIVENLTHRTRSRRLEELHFPDGIKTVHFIGLPFQEHVHDYLAERFNYLKQYGPNDGLTTLVDAIHPEGVVITEVGLDHYFRDRSIDIKTLALALLAVEK